MSRNIEIKARLSFEQYQSAIVRAEQLSGEAAQELGQTDTFFNVPDHRLKLREFADSSAELIAYARPDCEDPVASKYFLTAIDRPAELISGLTLTLGVRGKVKKKRLLFLVGQTRVHLDDVEGLGHFLELEVVLEDEQSDTFGIQVADGMLEQLGVEKARLVSTAYIDLLEAEMAT